MDFLSSDWGGLQWSTWVDLDVQAYRKPSKSRRLLGSLRSDGVDYAKVYLGPMDDTDGHLLAHELGHALGFGHLEERGHLMHPTIPDGGWNDALLQR